MNLPACLTTDSAQQAVELVQGYLAPDLAQPGGVAYTGSLFDSWDGGGDRMEVAQEFTDADVTAVGLLSVEIPPRAVIELLVRRTDAMSALLREIPKQLDLNEAEASVIGKGSPAWQLWDALLQIEGIGRASASKLLARKRPRLLPVYDSVVRELVGHPENYWDSLYQALRASGGSLATNLQQVRTEAGATHLTLIRVFDVIAWMTAKELQAGK